MFTKMLPQHHEQAEQTLAKAIPSNVGVATKHSTAIGLGEALRGHVSRSSKGDIYTYVCQHARGDGKEIDSQEVKQRYKSTKRVHKLALASQWCLVQDRDDIAAAKLIETEDMSGDGFLLAFVSTNGKKYLERYGHRGIVFDNTFNAAITKESDKVWNVVSSCRNGVAYEVTINDSPCDCSEEVAVCSDQCGIAWMPVKLRRQMRAVALL
ncbi:hypothetical protein RB195_024666 [Necator americanus]|uniref:Uncharacterized protein n=1 Tax=Necator americanus TaxID=51031 RepID=A0ABR1EPQ3_NECAM